MKKMTKAMLMTALICGTMYCGTEPVHANELDTFTLDEYVVTAARTETKLVDTPANITIVGADEIESRHYTNVAEVMRDVPGASVIDDGTGASQKIINLNGDDRVLVLVDGRRVNSAMGLGFGRASFDMNQLPDVELIERVEVMKGAGGALYGSDAVGGVINIITKKGTQSYGKVSAAFGTGGAEDLSAMYYARAGKTGVSVSASKYKQDYYKYRDYATDTTKRWPDSSENETEKVSLRIDQELNDESNLAIGYDYSKYDGLSPYSISNVKEWKTPSSAVWKETNNIYVKYDWTLNEKDEGYIQYYHNEQEYYNNGLMEESTDGMDIQQVITTSDTNKMVVGASWRESEVFNHSSYNEEKSVDSFALFVNDTWEFSPSWTLNTGARYDDHSKSGDETTFSLGLNKKLNEDSHVYVNWAQIYNAPNTDDLYYDAWGSYFGDENLKAETGDVWTIGYSALIGANTDVGINYFESDINDAIDWFPDDSNKYYVTNVDEQKKKGMEFTLKHKFNDNLDLNASYTYVNVKKNVGKQGELRDYNYVPNIYRVGLNYHEGKWDTNLWLRAGSGGRTSPYLAYSYGGAKPKTSYLDSSYITVDMAVTYQATKDLKVFGKVYNLLNEAYAEKGGLYNGSYDYPAQSRRFLIGAEYSF